ncbi:hypothetical protein GpartN1_g91.t1 [Galdieria partita]|uniref:RRM domain-containing protein n=1 Tax=Galdieria partita TaxID=83374 RepID=A0A9C7PPY5_9RHOD|nr:hypothetical protein GpartN1_g91.t1 [Galdieria partita]
MSQLCQSSESQYLIEQEMKLAHSGREDKNRGKVFVGGLSWETGEESLREYFEGFGEVTDCVIMRDKYTGHPRGFGFVTFQDETVADLVAGQPHVLDGRQVEAKKAVPRAEVPTKNETTKNTKKLFVGGISPTCSNEEFLVYFENFGTVQDAHIMYDHQTGKSRGFGFITFCSVEAVDKVFQTPRHIIKGKVVEVKIAEPKHQSADGRKVKERDLGSTGYSSAVGKPESTNPSKSSYYYSDASTLGPFVNSFVFDPSLASYYAQFYGGTPLIWQQYAAAAEAAAAAGLGYFSPTNSLGGELAAPNLQQYPGGYVISDRGSRIVTKGTSLNTLQRSLIHDSRYHPYEM